MALGHNELGAACEFAWSLIVMTFLSLVSLLWEEGVEGHFKLFQALHEVTRLWQFETDAAVMFARNNVADQINQLRTI